MWCTEPKLKKKKKRREKNGTKAPSSLSKEVIKGRLWAGPEIKPCQRKGATETQTNETM